MNEYILFEWIVPIGFALLGAGLVALILEILEWSRQKRGRTAGTPQK